MKFEIITHVFLVLSPIHSCLFSAVADTGSSRGERQVIVGKAQTYYLTFPPQKKMHENGDSLVQGGGGGRTSLVSPRSYSDFSVVLIVFPKCLSPNSANSVNYDKVQNRSIYQR